MKTMSSNLFQNFNAIPSPATWDCVGKSLKKKTKSSNLRLCRKISYNENQVPSNLSLYKKISKNENKVQQLEIV